MLEALQMKQPVKLLEKALIDEGCDILFVAAGGSGNGVFTAAKEAGNVKSSRL